MARIRTIKPDFWEDEKIGKLPIPCRLFFIGCWNFADDFGCIKGSVALLKSQIFPYDENLRVSEVKKWIDALVDARMLIPIIHVEESYYYIRTFRSHQVLDSRYSKSYIGKEIVNDLINKALNSNNQDTTLTHSEHDVITTEEMEMEKEYNPPIIPQGDETERFDFNSFLDCFNQTFKGRLPVVTKMTTNRKKAVKCCISEYGKESIRTVYDNILSSSFLIGNNDKNWKCDFDWIFKSKNYIKILEGNYNGKSNGTSISTSKSGNKSADERKESVRNLADLSIRILQDLGSPKNQ